MLSRHTYLLLLAMASATSAVAQHHITTSPGALRSHLREVPDSVASHIVIDGEADIRDLMVLAQFNTDTISLAGLEILPYRSATPLLHDRYVFAGSELPDYIFANSTFSHVTLPASATRIGEGAFLASEVKTLIVPEGVRELSDMALRDCVALKRVQLPSTLTSIGFECFAGCASLTDINLQESGIAAIGTRAFAGTVALSSLTLPPTVRNIGAFLIEGSGVRSISASAPLHAEPFALAGAPSLRTSDVSVSDADTSDAIYYGDPLLTYTSPLSPVPPLAYATSPNVQIAHVTKGVGAVGDYAFLGNQAEYIRLSPGVTVLGAGVFDDDANLKGIDCSELDDVIPSVTDATFAMLNQPEIPLKVSTRYIETWKQAPYWNRFKITDNFDSVTLTEIEGYHVSYSDGYVSIGCGEPLRHVSIYDAGGHLLASAAPEASEIRLYTGTPAGGVLVVRASTDHAVRTDKLLTGMQ